MLLTKHAARLRRAATGRGDQGSALVTVIAIAGIVAIISVTLVSSVTFGSTRTAVTRAGVQAQATAEDAIDVTLAQMSAFTYGAETGFPCSLNSSGTTAAGTTSSVVTLKYRTQGSSVFVCPVPTSLSVVEANVTARSTVTLGTGSGKSSQTRTVKQRLSVQDPTVTSALLPYAFFSGSSLTVNNSFNLNGGGVHVNGDYDCNSTGTIVGPVTATGTVTVQNHCKTKTISAGGKVKCINDAVVTGDITSAATVESELEGNCQVTGSVTTAGSISTSGTAFRVGGNVTSSTGRIYLGNSGGAMVAGYGRAGTTITASDVSSNPTLLNSRLNQAFASGYHPYEVTASPPAPAAVTMPSMTWNDLTPVGTATMSMGAWVQENGQRNGTGSSSALSGSSCTMAGPSWGINGTAKSPASGAVVIDARSCAVNLQDLTLDLTNDLTLVVKSFESNNSLTVTSSKPGSPAKLRIVVASTPGVPTCSASETSTGEIVFRNTLSVASNVEVLAYTNGKFSATNSVTFTGAVYACKMSLSVNVSITYADMTPPGMGGGNVGTYSFTPTARYDL